MQIADCQLLIEIGNAIDQRFDSSLERLATCDLQFAISN
jgi:hypothetical protein